MTDQSARRVASDSLPAPLPSRAIALFAAAIPVLLAVAFWPTLQSAFYLPKNAVLVASVAILSTLLIAARAFMPMAKTAAQNRLVYAVAALLFAMLLSAAVSPRKALAVQPLLVLVAGCLLMPLAASALRGRTEWLMRGIGASSVAVAAVAIVNRLGLDVFTPFGLHPSYSGGRMQIAATLGNPNFVASYVAASAPALLYLSLRTRRVAWLWRAGLAASFAAVWWTQSRIGIASFAVAVILPLLFRPSKSKFAVMAALALVFAASAVYVNQANPRSFATASTGRAFLRNVALADGATILGDGPGTFYYLYPERMGRWFSAHRDPSFLRFADMQIHAHNDFVEFLVSTGVIGMTTFLAVLFFAVMALIERMQTSPEVWFALGGTASLLLAACFDFPLQRAESWGLLWLWFSVIFLRKSDEHVFLFRKRATVLPAIALLGVAGTTIALLPAVASYHVHEGLAWEAQSWDNQAASEYAKALRWNRSDPDAQFYLARALANSGRKEAALTQSQIAAYWLDEPDLWELRAQILAKLGRQAEAVQVIDDGLRRFPYSKALAAARTQFALTPEK